MEVSVIERINVVLKHFCKTPNGLANMLEMIPSTVNRQLKGDQALSSKVIEGVLSVFLTFQPNGCCVEKVKCLLVSKQLLQKCKILKEENLM